MKNKPKSALPKDLPTKKRVGNLKTQDVLISPQQKLAKAMIVMNKAR